MIAMDAQRLAELAQEDARIARVSEALQGIDGTWLVGGAVRDLLLGRRPLDVDVVVEGDAVAAGRTAAQRIGGRVRAHERFGTATVTAPDLEFDLAGARRERYPTPGALPEVEAAPLDDDLRRRDFTVNTFALSLGTPVPELRWAGEAPHDLARRQLRVLHHASFVDDPTRLLRLVRYGARLGFDTEASTITVAREALAAGALRTASGPRLGGELRLLAGEGTAAEALRRAEALGLLRALRPCLHVEEELAERALTHLDATGQPWAVVLGAAAGGCRSEDLREWLAELGLGADEREAVLGVVHAPQLARGLLAARRPSEIAVLARGQRPEPLAVAAALGAAEAVAEWRRLRAVRLEIDGDDLLAAGVPSGPQLGRALAAALAAKLDGETQGRDDELRVALRAAG